VLVAELVMVASGWAAAPGSGAAALAIPGDVTNTQALGALIYTRYIYPFQGAGLILLVAMIGAIVLTLRQRIDVKRQDVAVQIAKPRGVRVVKVPTGSGV
jgi:NADH-quinone oxidoreductase subunit J